MRIGIDAREFKKGTYTGIRSMLRNFLDRAVKTSGHEFIYFCNRDTDTGALPVGKKVVISEKNTFWWDQVLLPSALSGEKVDVFFSPYIKTPFLRVCPYVNMICDVNPLYVPKYGGFLGFLEKAHFFVYAWICGRRSVKVITLSGTSRNRISNIFGIGKEKMKVIYPSIEASAVRGEPGERSGGLVDKYELDRPYLLYVGNFKPHKNLDNLVAAYGLLPEEVKDHYRLMLVGGTEKELAGIERTIKECGLSGKVVPVGKVGNDDITVFYRHASVFVFPSLAEGFGLPPVEAMASGVPVASSGLAPMTEILGEAALYFNPRDPGDISSKILELIKGDDLRRQCAEQGRERVSLFDPERISGEMMEVLEDAGTDKTLCVSSEFPPVRGGISTHIYNLWSRLGRKDVVILCANAPDDGSRRDKGLDIVRESYPLESDWLSRVLRMFAVSWHMLRLNAIRRIRRNHCAQVLSAGMGGLFVNILDGTPYVVYVYSADILEFSRNFFTSWLMKRVLTGCELVVASSIFAKALIVGHGLVPEGKVIVNTPGVDVGVFSPEKGDGGIRQKYGIDPGRKVVLTVARLADRKGHDNVIRALQEVVKEYPGVTYVIGGEGRTRPALEGLVKEKGLEGNVVFAGEVPSEDLVYFYNTCDIFVMTPKHLEKEGDVEGFGIVFIEAGACGKPVIAGKSGGVPEAVIDGVTGILVDPESPDQIGRAMLKLLKDGDLASKMGEAGLTRARGEFNWQSRASELGKYI